MATLTAVDNVLPDWLVVSPVDDRDQARLPVDAHGYMADFAADVPFPVVPSMDTAQASGMITVEWRKAGQRKFQPLGVLAPVIYRGAEPADLEFRVTMLASATHLCSAILTSVDYGGGAFTLLAGTTEHWHISTADHSDVLQAIYRLSKEALQGIYGFSGEISGRAFNSSATTQPKSVAWHYNPHDKHAYPCVSFSVLDADEPAPARPAYHTVDGVSELDLRPDSDMRFSSYSS